MLVFPCIAFLACLLIASQLYVMARYFIWYQLIEGMPAAIVMALMRQDVVARYTALALAQGITAIHRRMTK